MTRLSRAYDVNLPGVIPQLRHDVFTFQDLTEQLLLEHGLLRTSINALVSVRTAIVTAYRDLPNHADWLYYKRKTNLTTEAPYSTGTVEYLHSTGSDYRQLTLTGGTWPDNAALGSVRINNNHYRVESRQDATTLTLAVDSNPGIDVVAGTSYVWSRDTYPLPVDYKSSGQLVDSSGTYLSPSFVTPDSLLPIQRETGGLSRPDWWTIRSDGKYFSGLSIVFGRAPSEARTYEFLYNSQGQRLHTEKYSEGTVDLVDTVVTGTGTAFTHLMQGAVIRFSNDSILEPTGVAGYFDERGENYNPYVEQRVIQDVSSAVAITLGATNEVTLTGVRYTISDPIDVETGVMYSALVSLARYEFAKVSGRTDLAEKRAMWLEDLRQAKEADYRPRIVQTPFMYGTGCLWGDVDVIP